MDTFAYFVKRKLTNYFLMPLILQHESVENWYINVKHLVKFVGLLWPPFVMDLELHPY